MVAMLGNKEYKLRCKNAADKYAWLAAFNDPLALWAPPDDAADAPPARDVAPIAPATPRAAEPGPVTVL